jgi:hypothetical protein
MSQTNGPQLPDPSAGGKARAKKLPAARREEIAKKAADARWSVMRASHTGTLRIADREIECAVLEDGRRVLNQEAFLEAIGRSRNPKGGQNATSPDGLPPFLSAEALKPFITQELRQTTVPIPFRALPTGEGRGSSVGKRSQGYEAILLPLVCEVYLKARERGLLTRQQSHVAQACEVLVRGLAQVGIVALVDEATGYQEVRDRRALQGIIDRFLRSEFAAWAKRFPDDFYREMFRLHGWEWDTANPACGPRCIANYTRDLVYARLGPGILEELESRNPIADGRRDAYHHQFLTEDVGHPALAQHLHAVLGFMRACTTWDAFLALLDRAFPRRGCAAQRVLFDDPVG